MNKKILIIIFSIIVFINFGYALIYQIEPVVDASSYDEVAINIVNLEEYRANTNIPLELDSAIQRVGPGYELFLAANYLAFGRNFWVIWLIQAILYGLTIIMLGYISLKLFPEIKKNIKIVYGVMISFGIFIDAVQLNGMLMTESLFLFLLVLSFFIWSKIYESDPSTKFGWWIILGIVLGLQTLVRPTGLIIFILLSVATLYRHRLKSILILCLLSLAFISIQIPWFLRNYRVYHQFVFHSATDGLNVLSGNYPGNHGEFNAEFPFYKELKEKYTSPIELNNEAKKWYVNFLITQPFTAMAVILEKIILCFSLAKTSGFWFHYSGKIDQVATILLSVFENIIIISSQIFFGIYIIKKIRDRSFTSKDLFMTFALLALAATPILTVIANRHRLPMALMSLPLVIYFADILIRNYKKMYKEIIIAILILIFATSIDVYLQFDKFKDRLHRVNTANITTQDFYA